MPDDTQDRLDHVPGAGEVGLQDQPALPLHVEDVRVWEGAQQVVQLCDPLHREDDGSLGPVQNLAQVEDNVLGEDHWDTG